jgi:hypothetical protein
LRNLFDQVPEGALPDALPQNLAADAHAIDRMTSFSACVQSTLDHLTPRSSPKRKVSVEDVFVDIASHGHGSSVRRLREHGVGPRQVNDIVRKLGWSILKRRAGGW